MAKKMEIIIQIDKKKNLRSHTVTGLINVTELMNKLGEFYKSSEFDPNMNALWDMRDADFTAVKMVEVHTFVDMVKKYWGQPSQNNKAALIVTRDFDYGMSRMYEIQLSLGTSGNIMVFKDYDKAEKWLEE